MNAMRAAAITTLCACSSLLAVPAWAGGARPIARLVGGGGGGGGHAGGGGTARGPFLSVDGGLAIETATSTDPAQRAGAFGVGVGYQARSGVSLFGRYDDLGIRPASASGALQTITAGARFTIPPLLPAPYIEALIGGAFASGIDARPTGAAGIGLAVPIGPVSLDAGLRDFVTSLDGTLRQTLTLHGGIAVVF